MAGCRQQWGLPLGKKVDLGDLEGPFQGLAAVVPRPCIPLQNRTWDSDSELSGSFSLKFQPPSRH